MEITRRAIGIALSISIAGGASAIWAEEHAGSPDTFELLGEIAPTEVASSLLHEESTISRHRGTESKIAGDGIIISSKAGHVGLEGSPSSSSASVEPFVLAGGSALLAVRLDDANAPERFEFTLDVPLDAVVEIMDSGGVYVGTASNELLSVIAEPWARDAEGREIPTWFELDGHTLIQHINHALVADITWPILADPWAGKDLYKAAWVTDQGGKRYVVQAVPTAHGRTTTSVLAHAAHISELKSKLGSLKAKVTGTIEEQLICHVMFNHNGKHGGPTWSLESWRPQISWWLQIPSGCNP